MTSDLFLFLLGLLFILDVWTTLRILALAGGRELNPVMRWAMKLLTPAGGLMLAKFAVLVWISMHLAGLPAGWRIGILIGYLALFAWNLWQLHRGQTPK